MRYVIAGAGPAGVIAAETLRQADPSGTVILLGGENHAPYSRMAIPYLLKGNIPPQGTHLRHDEAHYQKLGIEYRQNTQLNRLDTQAKTVTLNSGETLPYDRLLIATGSHPVAPPVKGVALPGVHPCWTLEDAAALQERISDGSRVVLVGAGFIGTIVLDALVSRNAAITVIESEARMVPRMVNEQGGALIRTWCESKGVTVLTGTRVQEISQEGAALKVMLSNGKTLPADLVLTATGVKPNIAFLKDTPVKTAEGVLVNDHMQSSVPEIYAAGDVAQGPDYSLAHSSVHAIQPTAADHGRIAALNMAGKETRYRGSLVMNTVDILGLIFYSFGQWMGVEGGDHAEVLEEPEFHYMRLEFKENHLVGAIYIGNFEQIGVLRGLIQSAIPLGEWKQKLMENPKRLMEAYLMLTDKGLKIPAMTLSA